MRVHPLSAAVFGLSVLVIAGALFFQYAVGLVPCELCLLQRWPWYAAIALSAAVLVLRSKPAVLVAPFVFGALFLGSSGLAFYHVGVEEHVFAGPDACTAPPSSSHSVDDLLKQLQATPVVRCDLPQWNLFGVSLAGWNLLASVLMVVLCGFAWQRDRRPQVPA
jgi:disulfide bond formation protein DsbB